MKIGGSLEEQMVSSFKRLCIKNYHEDKSELSSTTAKPIMFQSCAAMVCKPTVVKPCAAMLASLPTVGGCSSSQISSNINDVDREIDANAKLSCDTDAAASNVSCVESDDTEQIDASPQASVLGQNGNGEAVSSVQSELSPACQA